MIYNIIINPPITTVHFFQLSSCDIRMSKFEVEMVENRSLIRCL